MFAFAVTVLLGQAPAPLPMAPATTEKIDAIQVLRGPASYDLSWSDAEDRLQGTLRPLDPVADSPIELSVRVGTLQGAEFDGPLTLAMRCPEWRESKTVPRPKGERAWFATFAPTSGGDDCTLDVAFTTTRHKVLHLKLPVQPAPLSRLPWYFIVAAVLLAAFGLGIRAAFSKPEQA